MRCLKCGNEIGPDEAFCGQCGTPVSSPVQPTEMVYTPHSGQLNSYNTHNGNYGHRQLGPDSTYAQNSGMLPPPNMPSGPRQQTNFYKDATEAMIPLPNNNLPGNYQQGNYAGPGQYGPQSQMQPPFPEGGFTQHGGYSQVPPFVPGQGYAGYGAPPHVTPPSPKQSTNAGLVFASVLLVLALITMIVFGVIYFTLGHSSSKVVITPTPVATTAPTPTPTLMPSPTPTDTPTPMPTLSPTVVPTPPPDASFSWCGSNCTSNGFAVEYPNGWNQGQPGGTTNVQFLNPTQQDVYANFKAPVTQTNSDAGTLVDTDLQTSYASQSGYVAPTGKQVKTIGGETWTYAIAYYQSNDQSNATYAGLTKKERVEVFATVHRGKDYIIELQAPDSQFDALDAQYFEIMLNRFQFVQSST